MVASNRCRQGNKESSQVDSFSRVKAQHPIASGVNFSLAPENAEASIEL